MNTSKHREQGFIECSICGFKGHVTESAKQGRTLTSYDYKANYCPRCGDDFTEHDNRRGGRK